MSAVTPIADNASGQIVRFVPKGGRCAASNTFKLQNIQASVRVGEIHESIPIHETITRLDYLGPIRPRIEHTCRIGRHKITNLARLKRVLDIEHANASVVVGCENET